MVKDSPISMVVPLRLEVFRTHERAILPSKSFPTDIGFDVYALCISESGREITKAIHQKGATMIPTGIIVKPPSGHYIQVCSRSGLATQGLFVANAPGIIDPSYTGEIFIILYNGSFETKYVSHGNRIAQLVVCPIVSCAATETKAPPTASERGDAGFGSTGA